MEGKEKHIYFDGKKFTLDERTGYYLKTTKPRKRLHIYIWEYYNKREVPKGYDIHHIDMNKDNNDISNLICITRVEHRKIHAEAKDRYHLSEEKLKEARERMDNAREYANEWHKSDEGRQWHKEHYEKSLGRVKQEKVIKICEQCGSEYEVNVNNAKVSRFCSNKCKSAWRRKSGVDNEERVCVICGEKYMSNKYKASSTCSSRCAGILAKRTRIDFK